MNDFPVSELRRVAVTFKGNHEPSYHFMHKDDVAAFVQATVELHYEPGRNPYNGNLTALLWKVEVEALTARMFSKTKERFEPVWWSTPGLGKQGMEKGARVGFFHEHHRLWTHPLLQEQENADDAEYMTQSERAGFG